MRTSRDVRSGRSSRPRHLKVLYFPHRRLWIMGYSCKVWCKPCKRRLILRLHSKHSWRLSAACKQEGEMKHYLEEKKASQKRPTTTFQRQDKKKAVYQTQQRSVAVGNAQRPQDQGLSETSAGSPARSASPSSGSGSNASDRKTRKALSPSSKPEFLGTSNPSHWGAIPNGCEGLTSPLRERRDPSPLNQPPLANPRALFGSLQRGEEENLVLVCEKSWTLQARIHQCEGVPSVLLQQGGSWNIEEEFPDLGLLRRLIKNPEEDVSGGFLGLPKESFYEP
ncbi:hypothetical protein Taro_027163 [Colocasia esculenta]|uniref:Uncharacterized protein n=1 Tax=Colocasia esculenta TaxID=4460 RepID=A0A843VQV1_COLES|nr:hypothetical protein [Colocasia esculenta]